MAQILVRNLDPEVVKRLKDRARQQSRSLQSEVKTILERAALSPQLDMESARRLVVKLRQRFRGRAFPDTLKLLREDRDR